MSKHNNCILNFSMRDLERGHRFYSSSIEEDEKPREKLINSLEARQFDEDDDRNK